MTEKNDTLIIHTSCICGACAFTTTVPSSSIPLTTELCHCTSCRHATGTLFYAPVIWPLPGISRSALPHKPPHVPFDSPSLVTYPFSENVSMHFCKHCGTHMFWYPHGKRKFDDQAHDDQPFITVAIGTIDVPAKITHHQMVGDTGDGGFATWLTQLNGQQLKAYTEEDDSEEMQLRNKKMATTFSKSRTEPLHASCHCKGVSFEIKSPAGDQARYPAKLCACRTCRLASGLPVHAWASIPQQNIVQQKSTKQTDDASHNDTDSKSASKQFPFGSLKAYTTNGGSTLYFCYKCGASCFLEPKNNGYMDAKDIRVAVGLLEAESGALAEEWLDWKAHEVAYKEDAVDVNLVNALQDGVRAWAGGGGREV